MAGKIMKQGPSPRTIFHSSRLAHLVVGIGVELVSNNDINGEQQLNVLGLGHGLELLGKVKLVLLDHGLASGQAAGLVEGENHASSDISMAIVGVK